MIVNLLANGRADQYNYHHLMLISGYQRACQTKTLNLRSLSYSIKIFSHFKLCLATEIHNFKWLKICVICEI